MKLIRSAVLGIAALAMLSGPAFSADSKIADKKANIGIELGLPLLAGPQIGFLPSPYVMVEAGFMQIGTLTIISLQGRFNLKPDNFRPYIGAGYDRYGVKDEDDVTGDTTEGTINCMHVGLGIEYAWDMGLAIGVELNYLKAMSASAKSGNLSDTDSLVDEDLAIFMPNLQIRAYF